MPPRATKRATRIGVYVTIGLFVAGTMIGWGTRRENADATQNTRLTAVETRQSDFKEVVKEDLLEIKSDVKHLVKLLLKGARP